MGEILIEPARGAGVEQVFSRCCGCYVCELVQEQTGQVLAKIRALKAWLNQPIIRQVQVKVNVILLLTATHKLFFALKTTLACELKVTQMSNVLQTRSYRR